MARPVVHVPVVMAPDGADGWNVRPGRPVILAGTDEITTAEAARLLGHGQGYLARLCDEGVFKTARKKNPKPRSSWMISRAEVMDLLNRLPS